MVVWENEIEDTKDALLHLTGISRATNEDHTAREVYDSKVALTCTVSSRISKERRSLDDHPIRLLGLKLLSGRGQEQIVAEQVSPGRFVYNTNVKAVLRVGTGIRIANPYFFMLQVGANLVIELI